ncbi:hypothetical protein C3941_07690 [Kaistia algarum]|uniref:hypothetical protein n=1 Tax=Kaistia algarum TaxID=2083279 RepID=UPI000CE8259A|nr:hypothetical protein [Kaistia algarum]MCX5511938.1 hypothetical protein [Kaistia algarum]PPE80069.1 hypothetical protein C3941_07690 [Kaistia algarum]
MNQARTANWKICLAFAGLGLIAIPETASAVVYCKTVGVPKGCVARPTGAVRYCTRPGYPAGCVAGAGAPGVGVGAPGVGVQPANRGGPVNRVGVR